jgi:NADH-quinone oxidoreductase subunit E
MRKAENKNAPMLSGWFIAAAAGLVAFAVLVVVGKFDLFPAGAMAGAIAAVVGLILGMPWGADPAAPAAKAPAAKAPAQPVAEATPAAFVSSPVAETKASAAGPLRLKAPRAGKADDLKEIEGIGPAMEKLVNELGFYHFEQIANWSDADVALVDAEMKGFKGRITRDRWVAQAKIIVTEGLEAFRERAKTNNY